MKDFCKGMFYISALGILGVALYGSYVAYQADVYTSADYLLMMFGAAIVANIFKTFGE